jgi:uncharacterized protein YjbI with pentapeptide repeats
MKSIFQFVSPTQEQSRKSVAEEPVETEANTVPEGLIPASQLPSAADVLADLFGEDAAVAQVEGALARDPSSTAAAEEHTSEAKTAATRELEAALELVVSPEPSVAPEREPEPPALGDPEIPPELDAPVAGEPLFTLQAPPDADLSPEIAASVDLAEQAVDQVTKEELPAAPPHPETPARPAVPEPSPSRPASDWAFEEKLAAHKEWIESRGNTGQKADFAEAQLPHTDLISVDLRYADLQGANLKSSDLLLADLRDACLVRTNLEESCLVGANLEGANLEGATLDGAMGLLPRQLAGADLHDASLPDQIARFEARPFFNRASQIVMQLFTAMVVISTISGLAIWKTKDLQLLTDSSIFPFLRSRAAAALPTAQVYLIAPVALFIVFLVLQFHLQTLWDAVLQLPAVFPDGAEIGQSSPRIIRALLRAHFRWMNKDAPSTRTIERMLALALAYWLAPLILLLFWARYLTLQDLHGTVLQALLVAVAAGVALYSTTKIGRPRERWTREAKRGWEWTSKLRNINPLKAAAYLGVLLLLLSVGTVKGVPHGKSRAPQFSAASIRRWAPDVFWALGCDPYANLTEAAMSAAPANWSGADSQLSEVKGARLNDTNFRYAQAYGVFLAHAHLWHTNWEGAFLSDADFRGADLGQATLRYAVMDRARLYHANLDRSDLDAANLNRADFRESNLSYSSLAGAILIDAQFQDASLYGARLTHASMERADFERTDLRSAYLDDANLEHADLRNAYLWSAKLQGADLQNAQLGSTIFIDADLRNADLRGAQFSGTVVTGANLAGAVIDGTDLRGALRLTASQVCSTHSRSGAILTDSLAQQVRDACGGPLLAAPAPPPAPTQTSPAAAAPASRTPAHIRPASPVASPKPNK